MADNTDIARLQVRLEASLKQFENQMKRASGVANQSAARIEKRFSKLQGNLNNINLDGLSSALAGLGLGVGAAEIAGLADAYTSAGNKIASMGVKLEDVGSTLENINNIANRSRSSFEDTADLYARLTLASGQFGASQAQVARATETVSKALAASGASTSEAQAAVLQLGQALSSGVLQGDELRSLRENAPIIAQAIATEFGVTIGQLKDLGAEGKLTSDRVFRAILNSTQGVEARFAKTNATIAQSFQQLRNNVIQYVGTSSEMTTASNAISGALAFLARNIDTVAAAVAALSVLFVANFARKGIVGVVAMSKELLGLGKVAAATGLQLARLALSATPIGRVIQLIAAGVLAVTAAFQALFTQSSKTMGELFKLENLGAIVAEVGSMIGDLANQIGQYFAGLWENLVAGAAPAVSAVGSALNMIATMTRAVVNNAVGAFRFMAKVLTATFAAVPDLVKAAAIGSLNAIIRSVETAVNGVIATINQIIGAYNALPFIGDGAKIQPFAAVDLAEIENRTSDAGRKLIEELGDAWQQSFAEDYVGNVVQAAKDAVMETFGSMDGELNAMLQGFEQRVRERVKAGQRPAESGAGPMVSADGITSIAGADPALEKFLTSIRNSTNEARILRDELLKLDPAADNYAQSLDAATIYSKSLADAMQKGVALSEEQRRVLLLSAQAQASYNKQVADTKASQAAISGLVAQANALRAEANILRELQPASAAYNLQKREAAITSKLLAEAAAENRDVGEAELAQIREKATELASLQIIQEQIAASNEFAEQMRSQSDAAQIELGLLSQLNPLLGDYAIKAQAAAIAASQIADAKARGVTLTQEEIAAINEQATATATAQNSLSKLKQTQEEYNNLSREASKGFVQDLIQGKSAADALAGALQKVADKLLDMALNAAFDQKSTGGNFLGDLLKGIFGRAGGGAVNKGQPYVVGESGREVFVPNRDGRIIPNKDLRGNAGAGGGTQVNINNYSGQQVQQTSRREGDKQIIDIVVGEVSRRMSQGQFDKPMGSRYGVPTQTLSR